MACDSCSLARAALSRRGEAFEAAERSKWRKLGPVCVDRRKQKVYGQISQDSFSKVGQFDPAAVEEVLQRRVQPRLDMTPTVHEIRRAVMAMGNGNSGGDANLPAENWKALMGDQLLPTRIPGKSDGCVLEIG
jgi:hypothetical protein